MVVACFVSAFAGFPSLHAVCGSCHALIGVFLKLVSGTVVTALKRLLLLADVDAHPLHSAPSSDQL